MASSTSAVNDGLFEDLGAETAVHLSDRRKGDDGIYRPSLQHPAVNKAKGYQAVIRILPNLQRDGKLGPTALEKHLHYADFPENQELSGYYDCRKNFNEQCELCNMYWALAKSKNPMEVERAKLISRTTKYFSYVLVVEDEQAPELVGKVLVWQYGFKIKSKIKDEFESDIRVEDLSNGMDLKLVIKEVGGFTNYDSSRFTNQGPISVGGRKMKVNPETGKIVPADQAIVRELLTSRTVELDNYKAQPWTEEQAVKVQKILALLSGKSAPSASNVSYNTQSTTADELLGGSADAVTQRTSGAAKRPVAQSFTDGLDDLDNLDEF